MTQVWHRRPTLLWKRHGSTDIVSPNPDVIPTPWLPFDMPSRAVLSSSPKKVYAHYFVGFRSRIDNDPAGPTEYWQQYWMPPGGNEGGTDHAPYGGLVRDRKPLPPVQASGWETRLREEDVRQARDAGFDGFTVDILGSYGTPPNFRWTQWVELLNACRNVGDTSFRGVPMPDGVTGGTTSATAVADGLASNVAANPDQLTWINQGGVDKLLVAPYHAERAPNGSTGASLAFWTTVRDRLLNTYGIQSVFVFCYVRDWVLSPQAPTHNPIAYGHSRGGERDATSTSNSNNQAVGAAAYCHTTFPGRIWMHPVGYQDVRTSTTAWWESWGTGALRGAWMAAINGGSDWAQLMTWDDFTESPNCPQVESGYSMLDLHTYYLSWFKTGAAQPIIRDAIYLSHRKHAVTLTSFTSAAQTILRSTTVANGTTTPKNDIEALVFLTAAADVEILVNGVVQGGAQACPAGVTSVKRTFAYGTISARVVRNSVEVASVTSAIVSSATQLVQDLSYKCTSSLRQGLGQ